ncbi:hypothetical protein [Paeniglutamicibacter sp.]|uniref:hypothetical protein n=1 Tax=Paeniglutamicibacter sp. TaxID=1934391 RepID=UPI003989AA77
MKKSPFPRLSVAVLAAGLLLSITPVVHAAPVDTMTVEAPQAVSAIATLHPVLPGDLFAYVSLSEWPDGNYRIKDTGISEDWNGPTGERAVMVELTGTARTITAFKTIDRSGNTQDAGPNLQINTVIIPAYRDMPKPVRDDRITIPPLKLKVEKKEGEDPTWYFTFNEGSISSTIPNAVLKSVASVVNGEPTGSISDGRYKCDADVAGKLIQLRAIFYDESTRNSYFADSNGLVCPEKAIPSAQLEIQPTTLAERTIRPGSVASFQITTLKGNDAAPDVVWRVDGQEVKGESGQSFKTPLLFKTLEVSVTVTNGVTPVTKTLSWSASKRSFAISLYGQKVNGLHAYEAFAKSARNGETWLAAGTTLSYDAPTTFTENWADPSVTHKASDSKITYQWYRNAKKIAGATTLSYTLAAGDKETAIQLRMTAEREGFVTQVSTSADLVGALLPDMVGDKPARERRLPLLSQDQDTFPDGLVSSLRFHCEPGQGIYTSWLQWAVSGIESPIFARRANYNFFGDVKPGAEDAGEGCEVAEPELGKPVKRVDPEPTFKPKPTPKTPQVMSTLSANQLLALSASK